LPGSASPTIRRRELGALLKALRTEKGWTVEQVAERLLCSPSKVSRLETGQRGASARDIRDLSDLYGVQAERRQQLIDLAAAGKQQAWWQARNLPYSNYVGLEEAASRIQDFGLGLIPGLLQTADYARAVLNAIHPPLSENVIAQRLAVRMKRQQLLESKSAPLFDAVIDEAVLHRVAGDRSVMKSQLQHLLTASDLPTVTIRVLPYELGILPVTNNKFIILSFEQPAVQGVVFIEGLTGDLYLDDASDLQAYGEAFRAMSSMAAAPGDSREIIAAIAAGLGDSGTTPAA
jgi:transcriptional regulator with XRE-family HTH domain